MRVTAYYINGSRETFKDVQFTEVKDETSGHGIARYVLNQSDDNWVSLPMRNVLSLRVENDPV